MLPVDKLEKVFHGEEGEAAEEQARAAEIKKPARYGLMNDGALPVALK